MNSHRSFARRHIATLAMLLLVSFGVANGQQTKQPSRSELQAEIAMLRTALADCQNAKQAVKLTADQTAPAKSAREDAIASLRAVRSALSTGANLEEFKKYQIESRIKVDALPDVPENRDIRNVSDVYREASAFGIIKITGAISSETLSTAAHQYSDDYVVSAALKMMISEDQLEQPAADIALRHAKNGEWSAHTPVATLLQMAKAEIHSGNGRYAQKISERLIEIADEKLSKLK